ncbi:hypothetical protein AB0F68_22480 [Micromonospora sp. NPDC023966]|uniref:hypothetical protein n=1 Tax=Micromonospora sp. NPDC023966 TaxID=3154699 RepID=UPI0034055DD4
MIEREAPRSEWVPELAKRIIRRHWILGHCERCQGQAGTCGSLRWARDRIKARRMAGDLPGSPP